MEGALCWQLVVLFYLRDESTIYNRLTERLTGTCMGATIFGSSLVREEQYEEDFLWGISCKAQHLFISTSIFFGVQLISGRDTHSSQMRD